MAFMMPVVKNDYNIYKQHPSRSRRVSECSTSATGNHGGSHSSGGRSRKVSECRSEGPGSLSTSPAANNHHTEFMLGSPGHRSVPANMSRQYSQYSRGGASSSSRNSQTSLQSPSKQHTAVSSTGSSPPKSGSQSSLNKFHNRLLDKLKRTLRSSKDCCDNERTSA